MRTLISNTGARVLLGIALAAALAIGGWYAWRAWLRPDTGQIAITTDRTSYRQGDTLHFRIRNPGASELVLCSPGFCSASGLVARVEAYGEDGWEFWGNYCASMGPLRFDWTRTDMCLRFILPPTSVTEGEIPNLGTEQSLERKVKLRIVYTFDDGKRPLYSNEFTIAP